MSPLYIDYKFLGTVAVALITGSFMKQYNKIFPQEIAYAFFVIGCFLFSCSLSHTPNALSRY